MDARVLLMVACACGFMGASMAGCVAVRSARRVLFAARMQSAETERAVREKDVRAAALGLAGYVLRNGVETASAAARMLLSHPAAMRLFRDASAILARRGFPSTPQSVASVFCFVLALAALFSALAFRSPLAGILVPVCLVLAASAFVAHGREREQDALRDQVPDALRCMEACLHAGLSLPQAFSEVASEVSSPAKEAFQRVSHDLELGYSMDEALTRFHRNSGLPELGFVAMALDVQYACGGSATPILRSAEDSIVHGLDLRRSLRVQTAQARLSAQVVSIMPFLLMAVLSMISPGFLNPFFADAQGIAVLIAAIAMQVAGVIMVRRMLAVEI